jgi:lipoprotein-anchoring transpeptidase ErfK/SrfK
MFKLNGLRLDLRPAAALGAFAVGVVALSTAATAAPLPQFPFIFLAPAQLEQPPMQAAPSDEVSPTVEMPARLKRQIVSYPTREAPGTVIIDTPNTYLYYVLGAGHAIRYGVGVGREGFTWSGVQSVTKKGSGRIGRRRRK